MSKDISVSSLKTINSIDSEVEVFRAYYDSIDNLKVSAWYTKPTETSGKFPAIILMPGYQSDPPVPKDWAKKGYA